MRGAVGYGDLLDALRGVRWAARRPVRGSLSGVHRSRMLGISPEFTEYRLYRQGDDPRRLDWRLLARTDRAYLRITNDRATMATAVLVDGSASMAYPAGPSSKWEFARRIALGLCAVAHASADPVSIVLAAERGLLRTEPRTRRGVIAEIARVLGEASASGATPLAPAVGLTRSARRIAIVSDFLGDAEALLLECRRRAGDTEVYAIHVVAAEELEPPGSIVLATDPEDGSVRRALAPETREAYQGAFGRWRAQAAWAWREAGATYALAVTDEPAEHVVRRIAHGLTSDAS